MCTSSKQEIEVSKKLLIYVYAFISEFNYKGRLFQVKQTFASVSRTVK